MVISLQIAYTSWIKGNKGMTNIVQTNGMKKLVCFYEEWQKHGDAESSLKLFEVIQKYKREQTYDSILRSLLSREINDDESSI